MKERTFDFAAVGFGAVHFVGGIGAVGVRVAAETVGNAVARMAAELRFRTSTVGLVAEIAAVVLAVARGVLQHTAVVGALVEAVETLAEGAVGGQFVGEVGALGHTVACELERNAKTAAAFKLARRAVGAGARTTAGIARHHRSTRETLALHLHTFIQFH